MYKLKNKDLNTMNCSICSNIITLNLEKTKCGHIYHKQCIDTWLKTYYECPDCWEILKKLPDTYFIGTSGRINICDGGIGITKAIFLGDDLMRERTNGG